MADEEWRHELKIILKTDNYTRYVRVIVVVLGNYQ